MADGFKITTKGLDQLIKKFEKAPKQVIAEVNGIFENIAKEFVARAKRDAPKDVGFLAGEINYAKLGDQRFSIAAQSLYAGFQEFGTKGKFQNIPGYEDVAAQLKGQKGGTYAEGLKNIEGWVQRKGIRIGDLSVKSTAWLIFRSILRNGIRPQPFFFKQVEPALIQLEKDLQNVVKVLD